MKLGVGMLLLAPAAHRVGGKYKDEHVGQTGWSLSKRACGAVTVENISPEAGFGLPMLESALLLVV